MKFSDGLLIVVDFSDKRDVEVLTVGKWQGSSMKIINTFYGEEAVEMYAKLVGVK